MLKPAASLIGDGAAEAEPSTASHNVPDMNRACGGAVSVRGEKQIPHR